MNIFKEVISRVFFGPQIPEELSEYCGNEIDRINKERLRYLIPVVTVPIIIILGIYIYNAARNGLDRLSSVYIATDALFCLFLVCCYFICKKSRLENKKFFDVFFCTIFLISLLWASILSLLDQKGYNGMTGYVIAILLFSIAFVIKPRFFTLALISILLPLIVALPFFHKNALALLGDYINAVFCSLMSIFSPVFRTIQLWKA
jgi:hypothetical protein